MPSNRNGRAAIAMQVKAETKEQLKAIAAHHKAQGRDHMTMTQVVQTLVAKEFKRLKI